SSSCQNSSGFRHLGSSQYVGYKVRASRRVDDEGNLKCPGNEPGSIRTILHDQTAQSLDAGLIQGEHDLVKSGIQDCESKGRKGLCVSADTPRQMTLLQNLKSGLLHALVRMFQYWREMRDQIRIAHLAKQLTGVAHKKPVFVLKTPDCDVHTAVAEFASQPQNTNAGRRIGLPFEAFHDSFHRSRKLTKQHDSVPGNVRILPIA